MRLIAGYATRAREKCSIYVTFPYRQLYVDVIKKLENRFFDKKTKAWEVPFSDSKKLQDLLEKYNISYDKAAFEKSVKDLNEDMSIEIKKVTHDVDISILDGVKFKTEPRDYQKEGIVFGLLNKQFLLADDMGLGKSFMALNIARLKKNGKHCLIICGYASLQYNWKLEVEKHTNQSAYILGTRIKPRKKRKYIGTTKDKIEDLNNLENIDEFFIITNINFIRESIKKKYKDKNSKEKTAKQYFVAEKINEYCKSGVIGRIIFDEFQVAKSIKTDNTKAILTISDCEYKIAATGTPIMNNHAELYPLLKWLGKEPLNYFSFINEYCMLGGYKLQEITGNKNNKKLNYRLSAFMLRRKKADVLDLPPKNYIDMPLLMLPQQEFLYEQTRRMLKTDIVAQRGNKAKVLEMLSVLRKITCSPFWVNEKFTESAKFEKIDELMETIYDNDEKVIILSNWTTPFTGLREESLIHRLSDYKPLMITGDLNQEKREYNMKKFQNESENKIMLGTYKAMGVGLTLTAANNVILLDQPWNKAIEDQGVDRAYRFGTTKTVNIFKLHCADTLDDFVDKLVTLKGRVTAETIDGEIYDELMEHVLF